MYVFVCSMYYGSVCVCVCAMCLIYGRPAGRKSSSSETNRRDPDTHTVTERDVCDVSEASELRPGAAGGKRVRFRLFDWKNSDRKETKKKGEEKIDRKIIITTQCTCLG